jgi:NADH dehydrogenase
LPGAAGRILGLFLDDIVLTMDEIRGLSAGLMVSNSGAEPPGPNRLTEWLDQHGAAAGQSYASEVQCHYE